MWGVCGQIEEKTKLAAWLVFDRLRQKLLGVYLIFPSNKQQAFQSMVKNADDTGWILLYQFQRSLALQRPTRLRHVAMPPHHGEGAIAPYGADELNKAQVYRDIRGIALHGNRHDGHLLSDRPHGLPRRVRQLPAFLVPTRDRAQYACREYYGDTPCAPEEVSEASSDMEYDHCPER